jgi:predicted double-glycine peptidase
MKLHRLLPTAQALLMLVFAAGAAWGAEALQPEIAGPSSPAQAAGSQPPANGQPAGPKPPDKRQLGAPIRDQTRTFNKYAKSWTELKKENIVMQQRDYSCGAAALATIMRYHLKEDVTELGLLLEVVRMLTPEEMQERIKNGLSISDLRRLAVRTGHQASIGKVEFKDLREVKVPLVVGLIVNGFDHFAVYRGTDDQYVYLADPARGHVRTPIPEFLKQWQKNTILVVVKKDDAGSDQRSPYMVSAEEASLGMLNEQFVRDQATTVIVPPR